ncbi:MAG: efflux RND transporter periplasmic adaptor subunit [Candidatus Delongbacteria bacterium]|nr:efflux RND transporter periplasmic adaptor subunit [Candidatus Delongbacteria bacterium]
MASGKKSLVWILLALLLAGGIATVLVTVFGGEGGADATQYHCPMHPTYISDQMGDCPICGMRLVPINSASPEPDEADGAHVDTHMEGAHAQAGGYTCPMHPEVHSDIEGRCPECHMFLVPVPADSTATGYTCPMHPEVHSDTEGRCPECGMFLVPETKPSGKNGGQGRILYYRNPMNPEIHSPVPTKDSMGMDFVPVYATQGSGSAKVPGHAVVRTTDEGRRQAGVQVQAVRRGELGRTIRTVGTVIADETRERRVTLKVGGWVEALAVSTSGQFVTQGDPVLSLYSPELLTAQQEYLQAREAAKAFEESSGDTARAIVDAARRRLELLDCPASVIEALEQGGEAQRAVILRAPWGGFVSQLMVRTGQQVAPGEPLFTLTDLSRVWVESAFSESETPRIRMGQSLEFQQPGRPGEGLEGRVSQILPSLDMASRTLTVRSTLDNPGLKLKPGMFVDVIATVDERRGLLIPDSAILDTGLRQLVYVETSPGRFAPREIQRGQRAGGQSLVLSGLAEGEQVAIAGNFLLDSESRIRGVLEAHTP